MFTLAFSCLTTSNLPWFTDLTFQVPMQYCSLQHQPLHPSPVTSTTGCCFCFGSVSSFFLELFLHWSPVWAPTDLGISSSVSYLFAFSYCSWSSPGKNTEVSLFPSPVGHVLSKLSTMTHPSWVALHNMAQSFIELDRLWSMWSVWLVFCDSGFHSVCPLMERDKRLMDVSWWERLTEGGNLGIVLMGRAMLSKSLIQFSVYGLMEYWK